MDVDPRLIEEATRVFRARLLASIHEMGDVRTPSGFCAAERAVHALALELAAEITQRVLQQISDDAVRGKEALEDVRERASGRGVQVRVERPRKTKIRTLGGSLIEVVTPYATAKPRSDAPLQSRGRQGTGVYPVLDQLGIAGRATPALRLLAARTVCEANSVTSARELLRASGVELDHKTALRLTYMVSDSSLRHRRKAMRQQRSGNDAGEFVGRRVVATVDGGRINIRRRVAGRPRKGGRKRFETEWREPKVITLYVLGADGKRDRSVPSVIDGTMGDADAVFALMRYHLLRLGAHKAVDVSLVADGAKWIWKRGEELRTALGLPRERFHEIVDYFHAIERLGDFSKAQAGWTEEYRRAWLGVQKKRLKAGDIEQIESVFRVLAKGRGKELDTEREYWKRNRERLRFGAFRSAGLPNGSGAVESSVRRVVNLRLKGASITWTEEHAEAILHLRSYAKSGRWGELEEAALGEARWRPTTRQPKAA